MKYNLDILCRYYGMRPDGCYNGQWDKPSIKAYHVTRTANLDAIRQHGLLAASCNAVSSGQYRREAVYLFAAHQDATDQGLLAALFGADDGSRDLAIIEVTIPMAAYGKLDEDGIFNMSFRCSDGTHPTAMQYLGDIPAEWIRIN